MKTIVIRASTGFIAFSFAVFAAGICMAVFLPVPEAESSGSGVEPVDEGGESLVLEPVEVEGPELSADKMMHAALAEAQEMIGESLSISEYSVGAEGQRVYFQYTLDGENAGFIGIDAHGWLLGFCDFNASSPDSPEVDVGISMKEALDAAGELLGRLGYEKRYLAPEVAELRGTGATGPPDDSRPTYEYSFDFLPSVNGIIVEGLDRCNISLRPEDGRLLCFTLLRSDDVLVDGPTRLEISREEAVAYAISAVENEYGETRPLGGYRGRTQIPYPG
ncbi:MAG: hypothetical protein SWK76_13690 [Actinomycetota bacterium]|nr:hypothetical protein [Actinomycetota bacterium]